MIRLKNKTMSRIQSQVLDFLNKNGWQDLDDFSLRLTDGLYETLTCSELNFGTLKELLEEVKTNFFIINKVSKKQFVNLLLSEIGMYLTAIIAGTPVKISLTLSEIFPKMDSITDKKANKYIKMIQCDERFLRENLMNILRKLGAAPIPNRGKDTAQEVADIELFRIKIKNRFFKFAVIIKGFKSVSGKTLTLKDVMHQVTRAYQRGRPDHIILASAKEPTDGLITSLAEYANSVHDTDLIIFIPPLDFTKILIGYEYLK